MSYIPHPETWVCFECKHKNSKLSLNCQCGSYRWYRIGLSFEEAKRLQAKVIGARCRETEN